MQKNLGAKVLEHRFLGTSLYLLRKSNGRNSISYKFWEPVMMTRIWKTWGKGLEGTMASMSGFKDLSQACVTLVCPGSKETQDKREHELTAVCAGRPSNDARVPGCLKRL